MGMTQETVELMERILKLPAVERTALVSRIIDSLGGGAAEVEHAWSEELARRYDDMVSGRDLGVPASQALAEMRRAMAEGRARRP